MLVIMMITLVGGIIIIDVYKHTYTGTAIPVPVSSFTKCTYILQLQLIKWQPNSGEIDNYWTISGAIIFLYGKFIAQENCYFEKFCL